MSGVSRSTPEVGPITLLWIDDDTEFLTLASDALESTPDVDMIDAAEAATAFDRVDDVDGVVTSLDLPSLSGETVLERIRDRDSSVPVVLHTTRPLDDVGVDVAETPAVDFVRKDWDAATVRLAARRLRSLVEREAYAEAASRLSVAVDACRDPILVVDGDGAIEYANGQFASAVSPARTDLCGRRWTELFADRSVERLQHEAVPVGTQGWTWSGRTVLAADPDIEVTARTTLVQLEDGSKVFTFDDLDHPS